MFICASIWSVVLSVILVEVLVVQTFNKSWSVTLFCCYQPYIHPLGASSVQSVGAAEAVSLDIGHNPGPVTTLTQYTSTLALIFADLGRMPGKVNPTWYYFNSKVEFEQWIACWLRRWGLQIAWNVKLRKFSCIVVVITQHRKQYPLHSMVMLVWNISPLNTDIMCDSWNKQRMSCTEKGTSCWYVSRDQLWNNLESAWLIVVIMKGRTVISGNGDWADVAALYMKVNGWC